VRPCDRVPEAAAFALAIALLPALACSDVRVKPADPGTFEALRRADVLDGRRLSAATRETLRTVGLSESRCDPAHCLAAPIAGLSEERRLSAQAELWLERALEIERRLQIGQVGPIGRRDDAVAAYLEAARASYSYLFFTERTPSDRAFDDRQSQVRDFANSAAERVAALGFGAGGPEGALPGRTIAVRGWTLELGALDVGLPSGRPIAALVPAGRLELTGVTNIYRRDGFGAPLVVVAPAPLAPITPATAGPRRDAGEIAVSAVLRFPGANLAEIFATRHALLEAYGSDRTSTLELPGGRVPLAANFTAPYLLWLERSRFARQAHRSFVDRSEQLVEPEVHLMQPYDPSKDVVVLLHGLSSSPEAWIDLANELVGDDELRARYQIWQVFYRSSAALGWNRVAIRNALARTLAEVRAEAPGSRAPRVVLVGHSMGGVLARLLVLAPGDALWRTVLGRAPSADDRRTLAVLAPFLDFEPLPEVDRAVFLAAPHRGAPLAGSRLGRLGARILRSPASLVARSRAAAQAVETEAPELARRLARTPDGIEALSDRLPLLQTTAALPIAADVTWHSIIGCARPVDDLERCTDGLVPYSSAHLDGAASELVVRSNHHVQERPEAIFELRRILREEQTSAQKSTSPRSSTSTLTSNTDLEPRP
jgi:pimeloyl-ACP methyl ester carboxylesterase